MKIQSTKLAKAVGDTAQVAELLASSDSRIEATEIDPHALATAFAKLPTVASLINTESLKSSHFTIDVDVPATPEGSAAVGELLHRIGEASMRASVPTTAKTVDAGGIVAISPTVGGMGLGLTGGIGLGIVIESLRGAANASGNPVASGLVLGFGLIGTAVGGLLGSRGEIEFEGFGVKIKASGKNVS